MNEQIKSMAANSQDENIMGESIAEVNDKYLQTRHYKVTYSLLIALLLFSILFLLGTAAKSLGLFSLGEQLPNYSAVTVNLALGEIEWVERLRPGRFPGQILGKPTLTRARHHEQ